MATLDDERYLRHILLLGEGGLLVLRGIVTREATRRGQTLEYILETNRQIFQNVFQDQYLRLFPSTIPVNADVNSWDMSLLLVVVKRLFKTGLSPAEKISINTLKSYRNNIQAHPTSMTMIATDYATYRGFVEKALLQLASGISPDTHTEIKEIIKRTQSENIDIKSSLRHIKELHEFKNSFLKALESTLSLIPDMNSKLSDIETCLNDMDEHHSNRYEALQTQLEETKISTGAIINDIAEVKANQGEMTRLVKKILQQQKIPVLKRNTENDLQTIIEAKTDHKEKEKKALDVLFDFVKMIQNKNDLSEQEIKQCIEQRIQWHGDICLQLIGDLLYWFSDIYNIPNTIPGAAQLGCIRIPIKCSSMDGLLKQMEYKDSANSIERLSKISYSLSKTIGSPCSLSWTIVPESLQNVMMILSKDLETSDLSSESEKIVLPFQSRSLRGLSNIWTMFEGAEVNNHLARASKTLSKIVGADITLTTSVVKDQFTKAVYKMNKETVSNLSATEEQGQEQLGSMHAEAAEKDKAAAESQEIKSETMETMETENSNTVKTEVTKNAVHSETLGKQTESDNTDNGHKMEMKRKRTDSDEAETEGKMDEDGVVKTEEQSQCEATGDSAADKMSRDPDYDYYKTVSLQLSEVLDDIGVNDRLILTRRRLVLLGDTMQNITYGLLGENISTYHFGSQSEGSTTLGLHSDNDVLTCHSEFNIIQDLTEWQRGMSNLLMIKDETTSPGYCLLQRLIPDVPLPTDLLNHKPNSNLAVSRDKVLLKNTLIKPTSDGVINGPAESTWQGILGITDQDNVLALHCKSWPAEAQPWLLQQGIGRWPTEELKNKCKTTGCFVVPVSSKNGQNEELEWRISTSQAERCLMFDLNITQLRCYILMKMILKTSINPQCDGVLSSFMCKNVLFHCIQNAPSNHWVQSNLLPCLMYCLTELQNCVKKENCPHFMLPKNNLMAGRISPHNKLRILGILQQIIQSEGRALLEIPIDDLGSRLQSKMTMGETFQFHETPAMMYAKVSTVQIVNTAIGMSINQKCLLESMPDGNEMVYKRLSVFLSKLTRAKDSNSLEKSAVKLLAPLLSSSQGSVKASHDIYTSHSISPEAHCQFSAGLNSDVASGSLKLASALNCVGDMEKAESVLRNTEEKYDLNTVEPICMCYLHPMPDPNPKQKFKHKCITGNEEVIQHITAFCVRFLRCEIYCVPKELQYEMFRSTLEDRPERDERVCFRMDWAVVDSLPYLYFLQYKTYGALKRVADQHCALANLVTSIETESNLCHRETALNLLGQCMEQKNKHNDALCCYMKSLNIQARNNAAKVLICRLLNELVNKHEPSLN